MDTMPVLFTHDKQLYRRSRYAIDFCFCLAINPCANKNELDGSFGLDYNLAV